MCKPDPGAIDLAIACLTPEVMADLSAGTTGRALLRDETWLAVQSEVVHDRNLHGHRCGSFRIGEKEVHLYNRRN